MKRTIFHALFLLTTVIGTIALFLLSSDRSALQFSAIESTCRDVSERNAALDSAVLSLRLGLVGDYDELSFVEKELANWQSRLVREKEIFSESMWQKNLVADFDKLKPLIKEKVTLSNEFKADHAIVRNALAGFLHNVRHAEADIQRDGNDAIASMVHLETTGSRFYLTGTDRDKAAFQANIDSCKKMEIARRGEFAFRSVDLSLRHAEKLIQRRNNLDEAISRLVAVPIRETMDEIMNQTAIEQSKMAFVARRYRMALFAGIFVLVGYCAFQFVSLVKDSRIIRDANEKLEARVSERTAELSQANEHLATAIADAKKLALVARYTDNAVMITDPDLKIEWVNEGFKRITGYDQGEVEGKRPDDLLHGELTNVNVAQQMASSVEKLEGFDGELVNYRKDGEAIWVANETRPILDDQNVVRNFIVVQSDITARIHAQREREKLQQQLVDSSRVAGMAEVATGVLHNVGNILNSVNVSASSIRKQFEKSVFDRLQKISELVSAEEVNFIDFVQNDNRGQKLPQYLNRVTDAMAVERGQIDNEINDLQQNVEHIKEIVSAQQSMAKSSGVQLEINVQELVDSALTATKSSFLNHAIEVTASVESESLSLVSDKHKILQILVNLLTNAKDALVENKIDAPRIDVNAQMSGGELVFQVIDNGIGIAEDKLSKIFQHGFTTKKNGHGFGLHGSANAATELGGSLNVHSDGIGCGATFELKIPIPVDSEKEKEAATQPQESYA